MLKVFTTVVSILAAATTIDATPTKRAVLIGEDLPWQIYNLSINALPLNMTKTNQTQHITFVAIDNNFDSGLNFTTICTKTAPAGQSIFSTGSYTSCNFTDAGFSLRQDGTFFFRRRYKNGEKPPFDTTTCNGSGNLIEADHYSNGPDGMTVVDAYMEINCTLQS